MMIKTIIADEEIDPIIIVQGSNQRDLSNILSTNMIYIEHYQICVRSQ